MVKNTILVFQELSLREKEKALDQEAFLGLSLVKLCFIYFILFLLALYILRLC